MTYRKRSYDYIKIFFTRPIWTELNVLFWKFLSISAVVILTLTFLSVRYYNHYSLQRIHHQMKQAYLSRLVTLYEKIPFPNPPAEPPRSFNSLVEGFRWEKLMSEQTPQIFEAQKNLERKAAREQTRNQAAKRVSTKIPDSRSRYDSSMVASLNSSSQTGAEVLSAIGGIAAVVTSGAENRNSPMEPYNTRKKAYESSTRQFSRSPDEKVAIAESKFTDFDIATGVRDYDKTIAISHENKKDVRRCFDRVYRNDPTVKGNLVVKFNIHPEGYVIPESIRMVQSDIQDVHILNCIKRTIRRWRNFPRVPYEMGEYSITQKYVF